MSHPGYSSDSFYYSDRSHPLFLTCLLILFTVSDRVLRSSKLNAWLWEWIKPELFYVAGRCQHSGNCCQKLMITKEGKDINTPALFESLVNSDATYSRFSPHVSPTDSTLHYFSCQSLTEDFVCSDYSTRPAMCHHYPLSHFVKYGTLNKGCGYRIQTKTHFPKIKNTTLITLISQLKSANQINNLKK